MIGRQKITSHPAATMMLSFLAAIVVGTILLSLPLSTIDGSYIPFLDALFTATSSVCVTGLIVQDTATYFSPFGQGVILALIQAGGLGIMTLTTAAAVFMRGQISISQRRRLQEMYDQDYYNELVDLIRSIVKGTLLIEFVGVIILSAAWWNDAPTHSMAIWWAVFHSVSAFCNAGFSLFSNNLMGFANNPVVVMTMSALIILGGLGFMVVGPLLAFRKPKGLHAKLVIVTTGILLLVGTLYFFFSSFDGALMGKPLWQKLMNAFFQSVTARTAGFNVFPQMNLGSGGILVTMLLMFIGASPGSTGGGIKTSTFATMVLAVRAWIKRRPEVEVGGRRIPNDVILKAVAVAMLSAACIFIFILTLTFTENAPLKVIVFEAFSAFGTVGLSLGLTPNLTGVGKLLITILMYMGRLGPVVVALIVGGPQRLGRWRYPPGRVMIG